MDIYGYLTQRNFKPSLHVMDNECSKLVKDFVKAQNTKIQFVEPDIHRVNAAERAIQTYKNHLIAGLCTVDPNFPLQLWDETVPQSEMTLNMLRTSRRNPRLSAYAKLEGNFNFDRTPLAPPGTKSLVYVASKNRPSFGTHAQDSWYIGPAMDHYRCMRYYIPITKGIRTAQSAKLFPAHCKTPYIDAADEIVLAAKDLVDALKQHDKNAPLKLTPRRTEAL